MFKLSQIQANKTNNDISMIEIAKDNYNTLNKSDIFYEEINQSSTKLLKENIIAKSKKDAILNYDINSDSENKDTLIEREKTNLNQKIKGIYYKDFINIISITDDLICFENKETCFLSGKTNNRINEIKSEKTNSNKFLNTVDKTINTINNFGDTINLNNQEEIINQNLDKTEYNNNIDATLKLTNSDFDKKVINNHSIVNKKDLKENNLIEVEDSNQNVQINNINKIKDNQLDLIRRSESVSEKLKLKDLISIDELNVYKEIPKDGDESIRNQIEVKDDDGKLCNNFDKDRKIIKNDYTENFNHDNQPKQNITNNEVNNVELFINKNKVEEIEHIEENDSKSENLNMDISNCISKNCDLINLQDEILNKSTYEKELITQDKENLNSAEEKSNLLIQTIIRMEKLSLDFVKTNSNNYLEEMELLIKKIEPSIESGNLEPFENISLNLWECLMLLAFKYLENDDIKNHYLISKILYNNYDKIIKDNTINVALAKFHFAKSQKDYNSNFSLSLNLFNESLELIKSLGEANTQLGLTVKFYLGTLYDDMGMYDESVVILLDVLRNQINIFSNEENIFVARTYNCLGIAEENRGNLRPAREYYQKAYRIFKIFSYGIETVDSAKVLNNLAGIYYRWEDFMTSLKLYIIVSDVYEKKFGSSNNYVAITYNNIGNCYQMIGDNKKALFYLNKALENFCELFGQSHPQTAMTYKNLGDLYLNINEKKKALEMFNACIHVFKDKYGEYNDTYLSTLGKIKKLKSSINI